MLLLCVASCSRDVDGFRCIEHPLIAEFSRGLCFASGCMAVDHRLGTQCSSLAVDLPDKLAFLRSGTLTVHLRS